MDTKAHVGFKFVNVWTCMCALDSEWLLLECSIGMKEAQHKDNWSWSTYGNLRMAYYNKSQKSFLNENKRM